MSLCLITPPAAEPVTLAEAKLYLKLDSADEDGLVQSLITAARARAEWHTGRAFLTQSWVLRLDALPPSAVVDLPLPPLQAVSSVAVTGRDGIRTVLDPGRYRVDSPGARVIFQERPQNLRRQDGIEIAFTAGYGDSTAVPSAIRQAILLLRGRQGSEDAMAGPVAAGARVVFLNDAVQQIALATAEAMLAHDYTFGPEGKPLADPSFQTVTQCFGAAGLRIPSVCHIGFAWSGGDLVLSWRRRDRSPAANSILLAETPQSDPALFDLEILSGTTVVRRYSGLTAARQIYTAAEQAADFASLPNPLQVRITPRSALTGPGHARTEYLYVR
jgi:phage conserved hypothetical protein, phiE125 gp8 family